MVKVYKYQETAKLASELGEFIVKKQNEVLATKARFDLAISGGSLVDVLYTCLVEDKLLASKIRWDKWNVFFCDERIVQLDHEDSNYGGFKKAVLDKLPKDVQESIVVFPLNTSLIKNGSVQENESIAADHARCLPSAGGFDLLLLGCGPDGHTCSLFPDAEHEYLLKETEKKVIHCHDSPKPPSDRITITLPVIAATKSVAFVAEGASKQAIMHEIFDLKNEKLPTYLINKLYDARVSWFVNDEAFATVQTNEYF